ncbi:hypothetical protein VKT23_005303 [Stygiomarasmius scandens]|uniref:Uncharacterized protein n=1 Tax=Marasmiellus scandens TaxID=2682957 RepID=A0ABR1JR80_9AGAR
MSFLFYPLLRSARPCARSAFPPCARRTLSYSFVARSEETSQSTVAAEQEPLPSEVVKEFEEDDSEGGGLLEGGERESPDSYRGFMNSIATAYKTTSVPRNWLGGNTPFPMNKSFRPPPPLSDAQREHMYRLYMRDPTNNSVRALSERYHLSLKRVDAILRLKGMEHAWIKEGKTLQTGFVAGMERVLGVSQFDPSSEIEPLRERYDSDAADSLEEVEKRDAARNRYQRLYWEAVAEHGGEPILPARLEHSKKLAVRLAELARKKKDQAYLPVIPDTDTIKTPKEPVQYSVLEGRPTIKFVDVGTKFLDPVAEQKRLGKIDRRARQRSKKVEENMRPLRQ